MRLAHNLSLAVTAVIVATVFIATSAFAQAVEVVAEPGGAHCGDVVEEEAHNASGGCEITIPSTTNFTTFNHNGAVEAVTSTCESELVANFDENGTGYIDTTETTVHINFPAGNCPIAVCEEPKAGAEPHTELEWPITGIAESGGEQEEMTFTFCLRPFSVAEGAYSTCTVDLDLAQDKATHVITLTASEDPCDENPAHELSGQWQTSGTNEIEILHQHYPADYAS